MAYRKGVLVYSQPDGLPPPGGPAYEGAEQSFCSRGRCRQIELSRSCALAPHHATHGDRSGQVV
jgi:hypothetical protein